MRRRVVALFEPGDSEFDRVAPAAEMRHQFRTICVAPQLERTSAEGIAILWALQS